VRYLSKPEERFARAYSQYIARKSGDPVLGEQIEKEKKSLYGRYLYHTDEEFSKVAAVMDKHFQENNLSIQGGTVV
jgi:hypothetical protein